MSNPAGTAAPPTGPVPPPAYEQVVELVVAAIGTRPGPDDDLSSHGLDSLGLMRLTHAVRARGITVSFAQLAERLTLGAWRALVEDRPPPGRMGGRADGPPVTPLPVVGPADGEFALAPMQHAYWIGRGPGQVLGGTGAHYYVELDGPALDPDRLDTAVRALLARHAMLRARFSDDATQSCPAEAAWSGLTHHDLTASGADPVAVQAELRADLVHRGLDVAHGEVVDVVLVTLPGGRGRVCVRIDMLVCDAQSFRQVLHELAALYADPAALPPPPGLDFAGYLALDAALPAEGVEEARRYWEERLPTLPGPVRLPLAAEPEQVRRGPIGLRRHRVDAAARLQLARRAARHEVTVTAALATAFAEVLAGFAAEQRFLLNLPLFGRRPLHPDVESVVGDFSSLLLLEVDVTDPAPFAEHARRVRDRLRADIGHSAVSGLDVLRDLGRIRGGGSAAPVVFTSTLGMGDIYGERVRAVLGDPTYAVSETPQVWLDHQVTEDGDGLLLHWDVVEELFEPGLVDAMFAAYVALVEGLAGTDGAWSEPVGTLAGAAALLTRAAANDTAGPLPDHTLLDPVLAAAAAGPDATALAWGAGATMTYAELVRRTLALAGALRALEVRDGDPVAVTLPRGPEQIVATLGVLAAGGAYVPVGIEQPAQRRAAIHRDGGIAVAVSAAAQEELLAWPDGVTVLAVDGAAVRAARPLPAARRVSPDASAYVIYTSGSTGEPKGVEVTHRAAANTVDDICARYAVGPADRVLAISAMDFDLSVFDVFGLLSVGGAVVLLAEEDRREPAAWATLARRHHVTIWNSVPMLLDMLVSSGVAFPAPRLALLSGDWIDLALPPRLDAVAPGCRLVGLGGATEAAIWSNHQDVGEVPAHWTSVPYGRPLRNQRFRVVDPRGRDCPDLVPGELWIGGAGVARGYRGDPARTARSFVGDGVDRWYRTGDLGRYWADGTLEFLGRADNQVKIRGNRVELGEIEAAAAAHPGVAMAVAVADERRSRVLLAVTTHDGPGTGLDSLPAHLEERLPAVMVPAEVVELAAFPLTGNGKLDRTAVSTLLAARQQAPQDPPRGPAECAVARAWEDVLGHPCPGRTAGFFTAGGDSLLASRLVARLRAEFGVELSLRQFFSAHSVADLAELVAGSVPGLDDDTYEEGEL